MNYRTSVLEAVVATENARQLEAAIGCITGPSGAGKTEIPVAYDPGIVSSNPDRRLSKIITTSRQPRELG